MNIKYLFLFFILLFSILSTFAQDSNSLFIAKQIDQTHKNISTSIFQVTNKIDSYFGSEVPLKEKNGSSIKLKYSTTAREYSEGTADPDIKINVKFKQLEKKFSFKFESLYDEEDKTTVNAQNTENVQKNVPEENALYRASIGFFKEQKRFWDFSIDTGVKIQSPPNPFARMRGRRSFYFDEVELRLSDKVMIDDADGLFNYTDMNINMKLTGKFSFSYTNKFVWKNDLNEFVTVHGPSVFQAIDDKQSLSYHVKTRFLNKPVYAITGHEIFSVYRRNLYKKWLLLEVVPGFSFFSAKDYSRIGFLTTKISMNFGDF